MEDKEPLLERPGAGNDDDDDENFDPLKAKNIQDFELEWEEWEKNNTSTPSGLFEENEQIKKRFVELEKKRLELVKRRKEREELEEKNLEKFEMSTPKTSTGRETLRPKKFKGEESQWSPAKTP